MPSRNKMDTHSMPLPNLNVNGMQAITIYHDEDVSCFPQRYIPTQIPAGDSSVQFIFRTSNNQQLTDQFCIWKAIWFAHMRNSKPTNFPYVHVSYRSYKRFTIAESQISQVMHFITPKLNKEWNAFWKPSEKTFKKAVLLKGQVY